MLNQTIHGGQAAVQLSACIAMLQVLINHTQPIPALAAYSTHAAFMASSQIVFRG